ncbi:MAG: shikimate kinase, partial [Aggregatilineales bacterium]
MAKARNIILCGFMGPGKTTVGKLVAARLGWQFVDTDQLIEARC